MLAPKHSELIEGCAVFVKHRTLTVVDSRVIVFREVGWLRYCDRVWQSAELYCCVRVRQSVDLHCCVCV